MKKIIFSMIFTVTLIFGNNSASKISLAAAEGYVKNTKNSKFISENEYMKILKNDKNDELKYIIKNMELRDIEKEERLVELANIRDNNITEVNKTYIKNLEQAKKDYLLAIEQLNLAKARDEKNIEKVYKERYVFLNNKFNSQNELDQQRIASIEEDIKKLTPSTAIKDLHLDKNKKIVINTQKTLFEFIKQHKTLNGVVISMDFTTCLSSYIKALKKTVPYGVEKRIKDYLVSISEEDDDIDAELLLPMIENKSINQLEDALQSVKEYKSKKV